MRPWRTSSGFLMEKMIIPGPSHLNHWHKLWVTASLLWSPTCSHPVILLYRRLRMQVRYLFFVFLYILYSRNQYLFYFLFLFNRNHPGVAVKTEGTLLPGYNTSEFQTSSWHSLLCPVLKYSQTLRTSVKNQSCHYTTLFKNCAWNVKLLLLYK